MATRASREAYSAVGKVLGVLAAMGTCFSIVDMVRNPSPHNFRSVCIFGLASWVLLGSAVRLKRPSFATSAPEQASETVVGWAFGAPSWVRPTVWIGLFLVLLALAVEMTAHRFELGLSVNASKLIFTAGLGVYLLGCRRLETFVRASLRGRYPDKPQVAISATGLWITGTEIPWSSIRAIARRKRSVKVISVDTIVVRAQSGTRPENIEIDLSDSVEDPDALYAKLQSAAAAHGAQLQPLGRELRAASRSRLQESRERLQESRELLRQVREQAEQRRARLPQEIAKTEAQIETVKSTIARSEARIAELEAALAQNDRPSEQMQKHLELTRANVQANVRLRDSLEKVLETQRKSYEKRR